MSLTGSHTYVGFGFGAIQSGLFLYEAYQSGSFGRLVVAEVVPEVVAALRAAGGTFTVNIARADGVEQAHIGPIEIYNPAVTDDREKLVEAIATAQEIGTAIPSVNYYASDSPSSLQRVLADGLSRKIPSDGPSAVVYTAENNNHAAEILTGHVHDALPAADQAAVAQNIQFLNTVVGKMSGIADDPAAQGLESVTPGGDRAFLVEEFNRILITRITLEGFQRGITVFEEKDDLMPFEEAKLYGHNATHALGAYLAGLCGLEVMSDLKNRPDIRAIMRRAFIEESGAALIRKYTGVDDLFTEAGYTAYADDLLERMINPYLRDTVVRVGRDPARKLSWNDRLIGTMRVVLAQGVAPQFYALGAAAALANVDATTLDDVHHAESVLEQLWQDANPDPDEQKSVLEYIHTARKTLKKWRNGAYGDLTALIDG